MIIRIVVLLGILACLYLISGARTPGMWRIEQNGNAMLVAKNGRYLGQVYAIKDDDWECEIWRDAFHAPYGGQWNSKENAYKQCGVQMP